MRWTNALAALALFLAIGAGRPVDPLPSWNNGPAKQAVLTFVRTTTDSASPTYVAPSHRIATFDQDGTLWVEHPMYAQLAFALDRIGALAAAHPTWKNTAPFKSVLTDDRGAIAKFTTHDWETIVAVTHSGMSVWDFNAAVKAWMATARDARWKRPYAQLIYEPMLELMRYLRANGYKTYIVTGGGQAFVRAYAENVYGVPPEQVIGSAAETEFTYDQSGHAVLMKTQKLLLNNNMSGKAEDIYLFIGRPPQAAFGNSTGDREMLEYAASGSGAHLMMLVLHDDAAREYAYGPVLGLPNTTVGTFTQALYNEATSRGWIVVSMKRDWGRLFPF